MKGPLLVWWLHGTGMERLGVLDSLLLLMPACHCCGSVTCALCIPSLLLLTLTHSLSTPLLWPAEIPPNATLTVGVRLVACVSAS